MKKAEIIKSGNVNIKVLNTSFDNNGIKIVEVQKKDIDRLLKKVKKQINWNELREEYNKWVDNGARRYGCLPLPAQCFNWLKKRLS